MTERAHPVLKPVRDWLREQPAIEPANRRVYVSRVERGSEKQGADITIQRVDGRRDWPFDVSSLDLICRALEGETAEDLGARAVAAFESAPVPFALTDDLELTAVESSSGPVEIPALNGKRYRANVVVWTRPLTVPT